MCGRFTVTTKDTKKVADRFEVELEKALGSKAMESAGGRYNVAPTQEVLTVRSSPRKRRRSRESARR